jgi:hypothetical protein
VSLLLLVSESRNRETLLRPSSAGIGKRYLFFDLVPDSSVSCKLERDGEVVAEVRETGDGCLTIIRGVQVGCGRRWAAFGI